MHVRNITDRNEKIAKLDLIIDWRRAPWPVARTVASMTAWLVDMPVHWAEITLDRRLDRDDVAQWIARNGEWRHAGDEHNRLGMAFAQYLSERESVKSIGLFDSPDIRAELYPSEEWYDQKPIQVRGDIGICSWSALWEGLQELAAHDMWISVGPQGDHIALVMDYNIGRVMMSNGAYRLLHGPKSDEDLRWLLTCSRCRNEVTLEQIEVLRSVLA